MLTIKFTEKKTPSGIQLEAVAELKAIATLPNYTSNSIDHRKMTEQYLTSRITDEFLRARGEYKVVEAIRNLSVLDTETRQIAVRVLENLLHELRNPVIEKIGSKQ